LSVDPVTTDANTGDSFNRYVYANSSPYKYIDPDGRSPEDWLPAGAPAVALGKSMGAAAAYIEGKLTGNQFLQNAGAQGLAENKAATVEALVILGSMGRGGSKATAPLAKELSKQEAKAIKSYEKRIAEHEKKIAEFKENPTVKPGMEKQSAEVVEAQQAARVQHLENEIKTFKDNVQKIKEL
jgi:hypothetical protein